MRRGLESSWGQQSLVFKEGSGLEEPLLCLYAIFGLLEQLFMVAETPDQHEGGPGRVEEGQKRPLW